MIDNLTDAIAHAKEVAKERNETANLTPTEYGDYINSCRECASEHEQLASWLEELKQRREAERWNSICTEADLPKEDGFYLTTVEYVESISGELKRNTAELYFSTVFKSWSECGEDEDSDDDIIAWKPLPKPYGSEA